MQNEEMVTRVREAFVPLLEAIYRWTGVETFVHGGCVRDTMLNILVRGDVDLGLVANQFSFRSQFMQLTAGLLEQGFHIVSGNNLFQLGSLFMDFRNIPFAAEEAVTTNDFTINSASLLMSGEFLHHPLFFEDLSAKRLRLNKFVGKPSIEGLFWRMGKLTQRGFNGGDLYKALIIDRTPGAELENLTNEVIRTPNWMVTI